MQPGREALVKAKQHLEEFQFLRKCRGQVGTAPTSSTEQLLERREFSLFHGGLGRSRLLGDIDAN